MSPLLELIVPSLLLPGVLSAALFLLIRTWGCDRCAMIAPLIWLPSCFWLVGWPSGIPQEAIGWLWVLLLSSLTLQIILQRHTQLVAALQTGLLMPAAVLLAWPVLTHSPTSGSVFELLLVVFTGAFLFATLNARRAEAPGFSLAASSGGLAVVTALGGSVLVGELAGAIASILAAFALFELYRRWQEKSIQPQALTALIQVYLALLLIARFYAGIPLMSMMLLLLALLSGFFLRGIYGPLGSLAGAVSALIWLLANSDRSYY